MWYLIAYWGGMMLSIVLFYEIVGKLIEGYYKYRHPDAPTSNVSPKLVKHMVQTSYRAFPLYVCVPLLIEIFVTNGWSAACVSIEDCGGTLVYVRGCIMYFIAAEFLIYMVHYYILHRWAFCNHNVHHIYKYRDQLNCFAGYSFSPEDGFSQGVTLAILTLIIPVPIRFVYLMELITGLWTLYIHTDIMTMPWPIMGCDYHYIHHHCNWYNFGFMTVLFDEIFGTIRHPALDASQYALGKLEMPASQKARSRTLTLSIIDHKSSVSRGITSN